MRHVLNMYAGLGGNRKDWTDCTVIAVESDPKIAAVYQRLHPLDIVIVGDALQYLLDHYEEFDFIWASPPCQSHSRMIRSGRNRKICYYSSLSPVQLEYQLLHFFCNSRINLGKRTIQINQAR